MGRKRALKTGKITTEEKYIIKGMKAEGKGLSEIAKLLKRTEVSIKSYYEDKLDKKLEKVSNKPVLDENYVVRLTAKDLMINETESGRKGSVAIMTEAASMKGDDSKDATGRANRVTGGNLVRLSDNKTIERGDKVTQTIEGPFTQKEVDIVAGMLKDNKSVQQIAVSLNRDVNDVAKVVNGL